MKKFLQFLAIIALIVVITVSFYRCIVITSEKAYFEGQKDAINGDIRIKLNSDSIYIWTKSCWNNGDKPIYNPTYLDSRK